MRCHGRSRQFISNHSPKRAATRNKASGAYCDGKPFARCSARSLVDSLKIPDDEDAKAIAHCILGLYRELWDPPGVELAQARPVQRLIPSRRA